LSGISFVTVMATIVLCVWQILSGNVDCAPEEVPSAYDSLGNLNGAWANFIFAFAGQTIFFEMNAEMKEPRHFPRSLWLAYSVMLGCYLFVCLTVYSACGSKVTKEELFLLIPKGHILRIIGMLMLVHMIVSYTISATVLTRTIFVRSGFTVGVEQSSRGRIVWFGGSLSLLICCAIFANLMPSFSALNALITDAFLCPNCFVLPIAIFLTMDGKRANDDPKKASMPLKVVSCVVAAFFLFEMVEGGYFDVMNVMHNPKFFTCSPLNIPN